MTASKPKSKAKSYTVKVEIVDSSYQPSKAELEEDMRVNATFDKAVKALARPVDIEYMARPNRGEVAVDTWLIILLVIVSIWGLYLALFRPMTIIKIGGIIVSGVVLAFLAIISGSRDDS